MKYWWYLAVHMADNAEGIKGNENGQKSQKQIETAVKFLQHPKVRETPLSQRRQFLVKKGLTEDEIQQAINLAGTTDSLKDVIPRNPTEGQAMFTGQPPPYSLRLRDFFWVAFVGGSFAYLLGHLVKTYLLPYILNDKDESDEKIDQLQTSVHELKENLSQTGNGIQDKLDSVQKTLQDQQQKLQTMSLNLSTSQACLSQSMTESYSLTEIKSELSSLKGLLLNRRQFPSPVVQSSPFPSIPAWQLSNTQLTDDADIKNENLLEKDNHSKSEANKETIQCNGNNEDTSSGTLELASADGSSLQTTENTADGNKTNFHQYSNISDQYNSISDQYSSISTMSSEAGNPNLSATDINRPNESFSDSDVKLPN